MLRKLLAAAALIASLLAPASAFPLTTDQAASLAADAGFPGMVQVDEDATAPNGHYGKVLGMIPAILLDQPAGFPDRWMAVILYHEIGHYLQDAAGILGSMSPREREWDADVIGAMLGCDHGLTIGDVLDLQAWAYRASGGYDDGVHGNFNDRSLNVIRRAGAYCEKHQSPWSNLVRGLKRALTFGRYA